MKILLISQYYWPERFGAGDWTQQLAEWLAEQKHEVTVLTAFPNYPDGIVSPEYRGRFLQREEHNGVHIIRTWIYAAPRTKRLFQRVLAQASFSASLLLGGLLARKADVIWYASPPLPGSFTSWLLCCWHRAGYALNISDIEPERSIALGLFKNRWLIRILEALERFAYRHADRICVLSEGTRNWLVKKGVPATKLRVTPNRADGDLIRPLPREQSLRAELGLNDEFVVLYSGNMGYTMGDLDSVVDAARLLAEDRDIRFVLAGEGVRRKSIEERANGLGSVTLLPLQSRQRFPRLLASADVCTVLLCGEATNASVPSKTYSIMAAGKPLLAICDPSNDTARVVEEAQCGEHVAPGDPARLASVIRRLKDNRDALRQRGQLARRYFEAHFSPLNGMKIYEQVFAECAGSGSTHRTGKADADTAGSC